MRIPFLVFFILLSFTGKAQVTTIYCIGDSTMADKVNPLENPEHGWAQVLPEFFNEYIQVANRAVNGRSSKSFISEGRWDAVSKNLFPGDYVFIQFGHNDQKFKDSTRYTNPHTTYRANLKRFVLETREKGAYPILFSSIVRRNFNEFGTLVDTHGLYPMEVRLLAREMNVPFVDLQYLTERLETSYGVEGSKSLHLHFQKGEHPFYPNGKIDNTHLSKKGAMEVAGLAIAEIKSLGLPLSKFIKH
ncbi:rhamnogalacturonan acetylesterase [Maribacter confluentis]|uniref:Rhamnogalacturonan acetylesterase n=1 Tax=Maribacter confluentis TaxID=1656093 RepID=A0ABT8RTJ2_9FLAO|nr:rhamnogalacturonan acetylesterase [Maribacter confluentis]MDO1513837.1 rhamnogalacturonan acetylesterase [Maribacter confluentis]